MAKLNPTFSSWTNSSSAKPILNPEYSDDGYSMSFEVSSDSSGWRWSWSIPAELKGKYITFNATSFTDVWAGHTSDDTGVILSLRIQHDDSSIADTYIGYGTTLNAMGSKYSQKNILEFPFGFTIPEDAKKIYVELFSGRNTLSASDTKKLTIKNFSVEENTPPAPPTAKRPIIHKILAENLPSEAPDYDLHMYFVKQANGAVTPYMSTLDRNITKVSGALYNITKDGKILDEQGTDITSDAEKTQLSPADTKSTVDFIKNRVTIIADGDPDPSTANHCEGDILFII